MDWKNISKTFGYDKSHFYSLIITGSIVTTITCISPRKKLFMYVKAREMKRDR